MTVETTIWIVRHGSERFSVRAHDWQPDEHGISFLTGPFEDDSSEIVAFFSHPVAVMRADLQCVL